MNTPEHYDMEIQPITYIMANGLGFCEGNIVKYVSRYAEKGGLDDLRKAKHYIEILINDWIDSHGDPEARERMKAEQARIDAELEQQKQDKIAANKAWAEIIEADKNGELNNEPDETITEVTPEDFVNTDFFKPTIPVISPKEWADHTNWLIEQRKQYDANPNC
jgi:hypothetical protein